MTDGTPIRPEELYASTIADLLAGVRNVAVGMLSPIPGAGALLARELSAQSAGPATRVTILGSQAHNRFTNGGAELFDLAGRGRIDAFFLSGGQIDGQANINLVGTGAYPATPVRWSGSFGSAYLYYIVPRVLLFRWEHSRRTLVHQVDFISAPGRSAPGVHRPGGPVALITNLCLFRWQREAGRFQLQSVHPGHTLEEVRDQTGFDFDLPAQVPTTATPDAHRLALLRGPVAAQIAAVYPAFAQQVFGAATAYRSAPAERRAAPKPAFAGTQRPPDAACPRAPRSAGGGGLPPPGAPCQAFASPALISSGLTLLK